ncbi:MAG: glycosyltransferase [Anaerolineae bacterium]|nr:glycosyltransferase [Anaerolineae bacterium]
MFFSLILTVYNEASSIHALLDSLLEQTHLPDEIVIVDGGSQDDTCAVIQRYQSKLPIILLQEQGCNISRGRNLAIQAAQGEVIVATDAGVRLIPEWFDQITAPFYDNPETSVVAGFFLPDPDPHSPFEVAMSAAVLPQVNEINPDTFLPSSRSIAFRKSCWEAVSGYPEWLDYCEDLIFDLRLRTAVGSFVFVPEAVVYFKPRTSLRAFFKQYFLYARGDGKADLWRKRHAARYVTYLLLIPILAALMQKVHLTFGLFYLLGGAVYLQQPYRRLPALWTQLDFPGKWQAVLWVLVIRIVGDFAKMLGYPIGWRWRLKNHPPDWKQP